MKIKPTITSFTVAAALALSLTTGVLAGESVTTTVTLVKANCSASLSDAQIDLGIWLFDPSSGTYKRMENTGQDSEFTVTASGGAIDDPSVSCLVTMTASNLVNDGNTGTGTEGMRTTLWHYGPTSGGGGNPLDLTVVTGESKTVGVGIDSEPSDDEFDPLTYTGTVTITSVTASN